MPAVTGPWAAADGPLPPVRVGVGGRTAPVGRQWGRNKKPLGFQGFGTLRHRLRRVGIEYTQKDSNLQPSVP